MKKRSMWALALSAGLGLSSAAVADITGTVNFEGEAPEPAQIDMSAVKECAAGHPDGAFEESIVVTEGKLANVVVSVKPADGQALEGKAATEPAVLDQKGCQYHPHVIAVMVGQPILVKNSDPFLHNVHSLAIDNPAFNFGQPTKDTKGRTVDAMKTTERFKVKCDVHPWMGAFVNVFEHPYFGVSKEDGTFTIPGNLPDGEYTLVAWHEKLAPDGKEIKVTVAGGKAEGADFSFSAAAANAGDAAAPVAEVKLASLEQKAAGKTAAKGEACDACCPTKAAAKTVADAKAKAEQPQAAAK